ncbi:MAG TPA: class I adenylate-forming enzyme family protein [Acidimicrobiales bacterium]|nr:class I adenylate-forming enzyme family protein [Acidimicrobiales bacterium]
MTVRAAALEPTLEAACRRWPDRPAITFRGTTWSYADLWARVEALARSYRDLGVRPGDRLVCQLRNCPEHVVAIGAAWHCGAVHAGTDNDLTGSELAWIVQRTEGAALVFQPPPDAADPLAPLAAVHAAQPSTTVVLHEAEPSDPTERPLAGLLAQGAASPPAPPAWPAVDRTGLLLLTSGTTGRPKAVMETLRGCWAKMQFFADALAPRPDDVHLLFLPMAHVFGLRLSLIALLSGGRLVLLDRFTPAEALRLVTEEGVTILPGMPTHFTLLLDALDLGGHEVASLRWAVTAAAALPRALVERIYDRLGAEIHYVYGCSENFTTQTTDREDILAGSVGREVFEAPAGEPPDGTIRVVRPDDHAPVPVGEVGELAFGARGPVHYWKAPDAATDGWYYTGDLGRIDEDGRIYVLGRLKELVNRGGLKVSPSEIEAAVARHPAVADAAVVGTPDPVLGEAICACIVPAGEERPGLEALRSFLSGSLARHKLPDELAVVATIPRTKIGKVDRPALLAAVAAGGGPVERLRPR